MHVLIPAIGDAHDGRECNQGARTPRPHARHGASENAHHAIEVYVERMIPQNVGHRLQRHAMRDAGIRDDGVNAAQLRLGMSKDRVHRLGAPHVEGVEAGAAPGGDDFRRHRLAFAREHVGDEHMRTQPAERLGGRAADADAGPRNQHLACHSITSPEFGQSVWPT